MNTTGLISFLKAAGRLKHIKRTGWVQAGVPDPESVADHSHRVALLSVVLADTGRLDASKAMRMAVLHDLAEAVTGDLTPRQKTAGHEAAESSAFRGLVEGLPAEQRRLYTEIMDEYAAGDTEEAALVHAADKLEMVLQALEYREAGDRGLDQFLVVEVPPEYRGLYGKLLGTSRPA